MLVTGGQIIAKKRFSIAKITSLSSTVQIKEHICSDLKRNIRNIHLVLMLKEIALSNSEKKNPVYFLAFTKIIKY